MRGRFSMKSASSFEDLLWTCFDTHLWFIDIHRTNQLEPIGYTQVQWRILKSSYYLVTPRYVLAFVLWTISLFVAGFVYTGWNRSNPKDNYFDKTAVASALILFCQTAGAFLLCSLRWKKATRFSLDLGTSAIFFRSLFLGRTWDKDGRKGYDDVCVKPLMYCMCELVFPWGNVNPGLINPLPPARRSRRARRSSLDLKWQIPPNKETSRPDDNYDWLYEEILDHASLVWLPVLPRPMESYGRWCLLNWGVGCIN